MYVFMCEFHAYENIIRSCKTSTPNTSEGSGVVVERALNQTRHSSQFKLLPRMLFVQAVASQKSQQAHRGDSFQPRMMEKTE